MLRVVNAYLQKKGRTGADRPAERTLWDDIFSEDSCILAGDFNAHSTMWNPRCTQRRNAAFLKELIRDSDFQVLNNDQATRPSETLHSIINPTLATPGAGPYCRNWRIVGEEEQASPSDHKMIEWRWCGNTEGGSNMEDAGLGPKREAG